MAHIVRADYKRIRSSDYERVAQIERELEDDVRALNDDFKRMYEAWDGYFRINGSGWEPTKLQELRSLNKHPYTFNICGAKTDILAGSILADMPDADWVPVEGPRTGTSEAVRDSYYQDKDLCDWDRSLTMLVRNGLVHSSWVGLTETKQFSPRGNIGLRLIEPGYLVPDSAWKTDNDRDLKRCCIIGYYDPEQLKFKYEAKGDEIERAIEEQKRSKEAMPEDAARLRALFQRRVGSELLVIEEHWLEFVRRKRLIARRIGTSEWIPFPLTDDQELCLAFAEANSLDMSSAFPDNYEDTIHHVTTICPELSNTMLLENNKSRIQTKGLPYLHFTVTRHEGKNKGVVAEMMDTNRLVEERLTMTNDAIANAAGGSDIWNERLFQSDDEWNKFRKNKNRYGYAFRADLDEIKKVREAVTDSTRMGNVYQELDVLMKSMVPTVSRVSDSMSAITESGKSGILFEREYQVNRIGNLLMDKRLKQLINNLGECYFWQWQITYAGEPREIQRKDGHGVRVINQRIPLGIDSQGQLEYGVRNAVEYTPRCRMIITESTRSGTHQMYRRHVLSEMLEILMKHPEINQAQIQALFSEFVESSDMGDKVKRAVESAKQLDAMRTQLSIITQMVTMQASMKGAAVQGMQADMMLQKLMGQLQQMGAQQMGMGGEPGGPATPDQVVRPVQMPPPQAGPAEAAPQGPGAPEGMPLPPNIEQQAGGSATSEQGL